MPERNVTGDRPDGISDILIEDATEVSEVTPCFRYDSETYEPFNCVDWLIRGVHAAPQSRLGQSLAHDPYLAKFEISVAQFLVIGLLTKYGVGSPAQLCKDL